MISRTLGAPLGGTTRGGHHGLESVALSLITPPNCAGGTGIWLPSIVVVALGEPSSPVTCCARAGTTVSGAAARNANAPPALLIDLCFTCAFPLSVPCVFFLARDFVRVRSDAEIPADHLPIVAWA